MKKHLGLIARLLVALAGIAYIVYVVDWTDKIELPPATYVLADGQQVQLNYTQAFRVTSGDFDPAAPQGVMTCRLRDEQQRVLGELRIDAASLSASPEPGKDIRLRPGLLTTLRHARLNLLLLGLLLAGPIYLIAAFRWWLLLRARGMDVSYHKTFRLSMVGCFFNYCMPGSTGGDLVRAYYIAKGASHRPDAVMTVIIDRVVGLLGLTILAGIAGLFVTDPRVRPVMVLIWSMAGGAVLFSAFYFSRRIRQATGLDWLMGRLLKPGSLLGRVEQAASAYAQHKTVVTGAIGLSLVVHFLIALAGAMAGCALGMKTPLGLMLAVIPVLILVASVPISYQGFGFMEVLGIRLLATPGLANANQIVVMLLLIRLFQVFYSLIGAVYLMRGDIHLHPEAHDGKKTLGLADR
jgi:uncharacterized protein (TIRG00374 family)